LAIAPGHSLVDRGSLTYGPLLRRLDLNMAFCSFLLESKLIALGESVAAEVTCEGGSTVDWSSIVRAAFPQAVVSAMRRPLPTGPQYLPSAPRQAFTVSNVQQEDLEEFLMVVGHSLTIEDRLDESHALAPHTIPLEPGGGFVRTKLGGLVYKAKDYTKSVPVRNQKAAGEILDWMTEFIDRHPRYARAHTIVTVPSSDPARKETLVTYLGRGLAETLGKRLVLPRRIVGVEARKDIDGSRPEFNQEQGATAVLAGDLQGEAIIIIDDLYKTGDSMAEVCGLCRKTGAIEVLGLVATKNATATRGMDLLSWPWG